VPLHSDEAIVLRRYDFGEADKIISFFTRSHGKVRIMAKGASKMKSRFAGRLEPFHKVDITYFGKENATLFNLSSVELSKTRSPIADDLERFHRACYITEVLELGTRDGDPNPRAFLAADAALELISLESKPKDMDWITRFFDVKLLNHLGYGPTLDRCINCGGALPDGGKLSFDVIRGGIVCDKCKGKFKTAITLSRGAVNFLAKIVLTEFAKAARFKPSPELLREITGAVRAFRNSRIQSKINSERFF
jgi:DNA repair protein RecO (recombination protein O)